MHENPNPTEPGAAPPPIAIATMPPELAAKGWKLRHLVRENKWRARNDALKLYPSVCDTPREAINSARELDSGKTQTVTRNGDVKFTDANPNAAAPSYSISGVDQFYAIARKDLQPSKTNARQDFDLTKLEELAASIKEKGIIEPLIVRPLAKGKFEIVAGERRYRAAGIAKVDPLICIIRQLTDRDAEEIQTIENDQREDLNPIERGLGYMKLIERHGHTPETLAAAVNKSKTFIYDQIKLAKLPDNARAALLDGEIPQSTATLIARIPSEKLRDRATEEILNSKYSSEALSFRSAKQLIERKYSLQLKGAPFSREDATLVPAAGACTTCPKLTGNNRVEFPDGRADVCTDPPCFNSKIAAHDARTRAAAKEKEIKVLPASECKKVFSSYGSGLAYNAPYIDLADQCDRDKQKKKRSYKQLLGDEAEPLLAIDPRNHRARYLMPIKDAAKILEKQHGIKLQVANTSRSSSSPKKNPEAERKRKLEQEIFERAAQLAGEEIAHQAEIGLGASSAGEPLKDVALLMFENALQMGGDGDTEERIAIRLGLISSPKKQSPPHQSRNRGAYMALEKFVKQNAPGAPAELLFGVALQLEFTADLYGHKLDDHQLRIFKMFPRVGKFETYLERAREELTKPADAPPPTTTTTAKAKAAGRGK